MFNESTVLEGLKGNDKKKKEEEEEEENKEILEHFFGELREILREFFTCLAYKSKLIGKEEIETIKEAMIKNASITESTIKISFPEKIARILSLAAVYLLPIKKGEPTRFYGENLAPLLMLIG